MRTGITGRRARGAENCHQDVAVEGRGRLDFTLHEQEAGAAYRYGSKTDTDFASVDVALEMDRLAEQPIIMAQLAALHGYRFVPVGFERPADNLRPIVPVHS